MEDKQLKGYEKKVYHGAYCNHYFYDYVYSEDLTTPHIKNPDKNEWYRYTKKKRHVFYEDVSKRYSEIIYPELVSKAGRPKGSKDSYKRIRKNKKED